MGYGLPLYMNKPNQSKGILCFLEKPKVRPQRGRIKTEYNLFYKHLNPSDSYMLKLPMNIRVNKKRFNFRKRDGIY